MQHSATKETFNLAFSELPKGSEYRGGGWLCHWAKHSGEE